MRGVANYAGYSGSRTKHSPTSRALVSSIEVPQSMEVPVCRNRRSLIHRFSFLCQSK